MYIKFLLTLLKFKNICVKIYVLMELILDIEKGGKILFYFTKKVGELCFSINGE